MVVEQEEDKGRIIRTVRDGSKGVQILQMIRDKEMWQSMVANVCRDTALRLGKIERILEKTVHGIRHIYGWEGLVTNINYFNKREDCFSLYARSEPVRSSVK